MVADVLLPSLSSLGFCSASDQTEVVTLSGICQLFAVFVRLPGKVPSGVAISPVFTLPIGHGLSTLPGALLLPNALARQNWKATDFTRQDIFQFVPNLSFVCIGERLLLFASHTILHFRIHTQSERNDRPIKL